MTGQHRSPGDPYDVGFAKPPKRSQFKKGISGNPNGRPRKKPDFYSEMRRVLKEKVTVSVDGHPERVTVQQALLLRLREEALHGEVWANKLLHRVINAIPGPAGGFDMLEYQVTKFRDLTYFRLLVADHEQQGAEPPPEPSETNDGE